MLPVAAGEERRRFLSEERDDEDDATYYNEATGKIVTVRRGSGIVPRSPWIKLHGLGRTHLIAPAIWTWAANSPLDEHFSKHADDFGANDEEDYAAKANAFYLEARGQGYLRIFGYNETEHIHDPITNTFGAYTADGKTITFFKPTSERFWDRQRGIFVKPRETLQVASAERQVMNGQSKFVCPICGYPDLKQPPRSNFGGASHEICPCCRFQFGYHDDAEGISYDEWRRRWVRRGMTWSSGAIRPPTDWNPLEQLKQLSRTQHLVTSREEFDRRYK